MEIVFHILFFLMGLGTGGTLAVWFMMRWKLSAWEEELEASKARGRRIESKLLGAFRVYDVDELAGYDAHEDLALRQGTEMLEKLDEEKGNAT